MSPWLTNLFSKEDVDAAIERGADAVDAADPALETSKTDPASPDGTEDLPGDTLLNDADSGVPPLDQE
jgi:hypothetical protein